MQFYRKTFKIAITVTIISAVLFTLAVAGVAGESNTAVSPESADVVVEPGESIQNAIDNASAGETVEVQAGTYEEALVINKNIELVAVGDVTLDGNNVDTEDGVTVDANEFSIDGFEIARFSGDGIVVQGNVLGGRTIEISNVTSRLNGGSNIEVLEGQDQDTVDLHNVEASGGSVGHGIYVAAETVVAEKVESEENDDSGLFIAAGSEGDVTIRDSTIADNGDDDLNDNEDGIYVASAQSITVDNVDVVNNNEDGFYVEETDAIAGGRTVEITNVTSRLNNGNMRIYGTQDEDSVTLHNIEAKGGNAGHGIYISAESVVAEEIISEENEDSGLFVKAGSEGSVTVRNGTFAGNGDGDSVDEEDGIHVSRTNSVTIKNVETTGQEGDGVQIEGTDATAGGRTVEITNVTSRSNGGNNIEVRGTEDDDAVDIRNIEARNNNAGAGIYIEGQTIVANDIVSKSSEDAGLWMASGATGEVTIQNGTFSDNGDGDRRDREDGIYVETAQSVTVGNVEALRNTDAGIRLASSDATAGGRMVKITNVTSRLNGDNNIGIYESADPDTAELREIETRNNDNTAGIYLGTETVFVEDVVSVGSEDAGLWIDSGTGGDITVQNGTFSNSGDDDSQEEDGIYVASAQSITIENVQTNENVESGVDIADTTAAAGGRTVEIRNVTSRLNGRHGGAIGGTSDSDDLVVNESSFVENGDDGLWVGADSTTVLQSAVEQNDEAGIRFTSGIGNSSVDQSQILDNSGPEIINEDESAVIDARNNWWGDSAGPAEDEIVGNVIVEDFLGSPPGADIVTVPETLDLEPGEEATVEIEISGADDGVAAYSFVLDVANVSVVEIVDVTPTNDPEFPTVDIAEDGGKANVDVGMGTNIHERSDPTLVELTVAAVADGDTAVAVEDASVAAPGDEQYLIGATSGASLTVAEEVGPPPVAGDNPPRDLNGDGLFRDINGDEEFDIFDVQAFFDNLNSDVIQQNAKFFKFSGRDTNEVTIFDVQALFSDL